MKGRQRLGTIFCLTLWACGVANAVGAVDFAREVKPIFEKKCFSCHGAEKQKGGLRLDRKVSTLKGGDSGPALVPGKSGESLLWKLVTGQDSERVMPQKGERLSQEQVEVLRQWIDSGALRPDDSDDPLDWWSLKPLRAPEVPHESHPIDAFISKKFAESGLSPAPQATPRALLRRLYFDLIGLPPTREEIAAFERDPLPQAYERIVDNLLASPRYGERWARHWMDVARFAETHGHDQDRIRENAWPYRDYLIRAFNEDMPYGRFVEEQIAGDALYPDNPAAIPALGFLAAGPWDESSLRDIREDTIDREIGRYLDRDEVVTAVMQTFASTTVNCARCHNHKFDPVPQADYYALQAVFAGVDRANRAYDADPSVHNRRRELRTNLARVNSRDAAFLEKNERTVAVFEKARGTDLWRPIVAETFISANGATLAVQNDGSLLAFGTRPDKDTYMISWTQKPGSVTAIRLEVLPDDSLPKRGPGRQPENGNFHLNEVALTAFPSGSDTGRMVRILAASADFDQQGWDVKQSIDGDEKTAWAIHPKTGEKHEAVFELAEVLQFTKETKFTLLLKQVHGGSHLLGRFRISTTEVEPRVVRALSEKIATIVKIPKEERTPEQRLELSTFVLRALIERDLAALPAGQLVYAAANDFAPDGSHKPAAKPRTVHMLHRGDIRRPRDEAKAGALECVTNLQCRFEVTAGEHEGKRRAELARWLTHRENPLTWRSIVNRAWQYHFGRGIVDTPNDFGRMGGAPSHPELLDWLACWFRDSGGSLKQLHKLILTSAAWQRTSDASPEMMVKDADNRLLARMNRLRLDAECVRDAVLATSGRLDLRMGGPSDRHFDLQPGIHVTPKVDYAKFNPASADANRRSVYRFLFRTLPDPTMDALDCPAGDQVTATRNSGVTIQQCLALWNGSLVATGSEATAEKISRSKKSVDAQVNESFKLVLGRDARKDELAEFADYARRHGLANVCRVLYNSNEFLFVD